MNVVNKIIWGVICAGIILALIPAFLPEPNDGLPKQLRIAKLCFSQEGPIVPIEQCRQRYREAVAEWRPPLKHPSQYYPESGGVLYLKN